MLFEIMASPDMVKVPLYTATPPPLRVAVLPVISPPDILKVPLLPT